VRRVAQYAIARPSREICFTVVDQSSRYKAKNVIDTVVYRFGDVSSAWVQAGLRPMGYASSRRNVRCTFRICKRNLDFDAVREAGVDRSFHLPVFTPAT